MNIWESARGVEMAERILIALEKMSEALTKKEVAAEASCIEKIILDYIGENYGSQEMEDPCYNVELLAAEIASKISKR